MQLPETVGKHWPEYLMEAAGLGCFMVSACLFTALLEYPASPVRRAIPDPLSRRAIVGVAMGATAIAIIYSPWGQRSGAHLNPSVTLTFLTMKRIGAWDALFYMVAQFAGSLLGVMLSGWLLGDVLRHPAVNYIVTVPGKSGAATAFWAEFLISGLLMTTVLLVSGTPVLSRLTGVFAGVLIALYVAVEAPLSGMSMNPARTFGSAAPAHLWDAWWVYATAPVGGMLLAGRVYQLGQTANAARCRSIVPCTLCKSGGAGAR